MEKYSYERRAYESVDDGSPSWVAFQKWTENKIQTVKGLNSHTYLNTAQLEICVPGDGTNDIQLITEAKCTMLSLIITFTFISYINQKN